MFNLHSMSKITSHVLTAWLGTLIFFSSLFPNPNVQTQKVNWTWMAPSSRAVKATPPWLELPREITAAILHKLGPLEILATAQNVCTTWRSMCQDPSMWRCIDMRAARNIWDEIDRDKVCRQAVDLSQGQLIDIYLNHSTSDLLLYVCER